MPLLDKGATFLGTSISFTDVSGYNRVYRELERSKHALETASEELRSTNEELQTINDELQERSVQLNQVNTFMEQIMASLQLGVAVLDIGLPLAELASPINKCLSNGDGHQELTLPATNRRGKSFTCRVHCTSVGGIDGARNVLLLMEAVEPER